jgi:hypothetical protein
MVGQLFNTEKRFRRYSLFTALKHRSIIGRFIGEIPEPVKRRAYHPATLNP